VTTTDIKPAVDRAVPTIGTVLGGTYRLTRLLAEGGCGNVYVATHERLGSEVAVKVLHAGLAGNARLLARLRREADILSAVRHPHIVQILDFDVTEWGVPFLVMEMLEGRPLTEGAAAGTPFDPRAAAHIIEQVAQALAAAHAQRVVHLDLKPDNIVLISTDGRDDFVKVIDFGISRAIWQAQLINEPLIAGTPEYMAPEQAGGLNDEIDHRTDQFALTALTYRLLTGHDPFAGADPMAILAQVVNETPHPPSAHVPWLGPGVDAVIARGLSKRPAERYPNVTDFAEALRGAVDEIAIDRRQVSRPPPEPAADLPPQLLTWADPSEPPQLLVERKTLPFLRRTRSTSLGRKSGAFLLALAAGAALVWFSPATRATARSAWRRAGAKVRKAVATTTTRHPPDPAPSRTASGP
jgi:eukaryotic-like serine/threonine-protein kinase